MGSSQGRLAKAFGISADEHGDSQWFPESDAELEVIGLGLSRTGTTSLRAALDSLGFGPVHHGVEIYRREDHRERTIKFLHFLTQQPKDKPPTAATVKQLRSWMRGYRSTLDGPVCDLVPELVAAYPKAKFILTLRDSEKIWWDSWIESVGIHFDTGLRRWIFRSLISSVRLLRRMDDMANEDKRRLVRDFGSIGPHVYRMHNQQVRDLVPKGRLLEYNIKQGWGPLCEFLEVDVPDRPFPRLNEGGSIQAIYFGMQVFGAGAWAFYLGLAGAAAWVALNPERARTASSVALGWIMDRFTR